MTRPNPYGENASGPMPADGAHPRPASLPIGRPLSARDGPPREGRAYKHPPHARGVGPSTQTLLSLPSGCLVTMGSMIVVAGLLALAVLAFRHPGYRATATYRAVLAEVNSLDEATASLGSPIRETGLIAFRADRDNRGLRRHITLRVVGPKGEGTLLAIVRRAGDLIRIETLRLIHTETRETVVLLGRSEQSGTAPRKRTRGADDAINE